MIFLIDEFCTQQQIKRAKIYESRINVFGQVHCFRIGVEEGPAKLSDIVPLAHSISDILCFAVTRHYAAEGRPVSCRKDCCSCCDYLVPLSLPEVYYLQYHIEALQDDIRVPVLSSCITASQKILSNHNLDKYNITNGGGLFQISQWYGELKLSCPFLKANICDIYDKRPLACREYMATGSPCLCKKSQLGSPKVVKMPFSILEVLGQLAESLEQTEIEAVLLPLALACVDSYQERSNCTWSAVMVVERFIEIMESVSVTWNDIMAVVI